jgi:hypothetical protein
MSNQFEFTSVGYKWKMQNHLTNTMEDATAEQFSERKKDRLGKATAKLTKKSECYTTEMELTTIEKTALEDDFARQLNDIKALTNTRNSDLFDLLLQLVAENLNINRNDNKELEKIDLSKTQYKLALNEVCDRFGITYRSAYNLCNDFMKVLVDDLHFKFRVQKRKKDDFTTLGRFNAVSSSVIRRNTLIVNFTPEFMFVLANTGNRLPMLTVGLDYNPKQLKYMGPLRRKLEFYWWECVKDSKKKFGVYVRLKLANLLPYFSGADMKQRPLESFVNPLKRHLSHLEGTGYLKCKFTGPKGAPLSSDFRSYLEVNKDGELIAECEAGEGVNAVPRIKVNDLLNNVYLTYTFLENPETKGTKKTRKKITATK